MKNNKTVQAGSFDRNSNATAAGAEGGSDELEGGSDELDLYSLSDGELESLVAGAIDLSALGSEIPGVILALT